MNKQLLIEYLPFMVSPQQLKEGLAKTGNLIVEGVIQRAGTRNQNGRIYPKHVLAREADLYTKTVIAENRALGELDHPSCFVDGYKILTKDKGWVEFKNLTGEELVATLNKDTQKLEFQKIIKIINQDYTGEIIKLESKGFLAEVTPNHKFITIDQNLDKLKFITAEKFKNQLIPKKSEYIIPKVEKVNISNEFGEIEIRSDLFAKFIGWWLAEGWVSNKKTKHPNISISQSPEKSENILILNDLIEELSKELDSYYNIQKTEKEYTYNISNKVLTNYLLQFGLSYDKFIPKEIKDLDKENIQVFLSSYLRGDGHKSKNQEIYYTSSETMSKDLLELINLTGWMGSIKIKESYLNEYLVESDGEKIWMSDFDYYYKNRDKYFGKNIISKKRIFTGRKLYTISRKYSKTYQVNDMKKKSYQYSGKIYCVSVPNEIILVLSPKGSTFWSGNSEVINLKNASHNIKRIWWDGDDLYGRVEILSTPSGNILKTLFQEGITVGISSRGLGSVKPLGEGTVEVQDDFSIVAWDFVSTPSTHGSFMRPINQLNEGIEFRTQNKYTKVNSIITEILCNRVGYCECDMQIGRAHV